MKNKFKIRILLTIFIPMLLLPLAQTQEFYQNAQSAKISIILSNIIHNNAKELTANVYLFPKELENQRTRIITSPVSRTENGTIVFEFKEEGNIEIKVIAEAEKKFVMEKIGKINLSDARNPKNLEGLEIYTKPSTYVLSKDPFIKNKAQQLATEDAFETLYNLAEYVRNSMQYDINYREPRNASWIMQEKRGVCSHYTILFMALARSLGLATRYVSGEAYSNLEKKCGEHAWAEVYLPGHGWIPFDINFGQYGWLDASHVVMMYSTDAGAPLITYQYIGELEKEDLKIDAEIKEIGENVSVPLEIEIDPLLEVISPDSYLPVQVKVKNPYNYYIALPVHMSLSPGVFGSNERVILLKPRSVGKGYFIAYIAPENYEECKKGCIATLEIRDVFGNSGITFVKFEKDASRISLDDAQKIATIYGREREIDFYCKIEEPFYYEYEDINVECVVSNGHETKNLSICHQEVCTNFTLSSNETKNIFFGIPALMNNLESANRTIMKCLVLCVTAKEQRNVLGMACLDTTILETPNITITAIQNTIADYGTKGNLELIIESNFITSAEISIETQAYTDKFNISLEKGKNAINAPVKTWKLKTGMNPMRITIYIEDKKGRKYETSKEIEFTVNEVNLLRKIFVAIIHFFG